MNNQAMQKWQKKREMGKKAYVLRYGIIMFGMVLAVLTTLLELASTHTIHFPYMISRFVVFPVLGLMGASMVWESREKKYAESLESSSKTKVRKK